MALYLDTEYNCFHGQLISLAIASTEGDHWYRALPLPADVDPWVKHYVVPHINIEPTEPSAFKASLWAYLRQHASEPIFADWPEDFAHLMQWLCKPHGVALTIELTMHLIQSDTLYSKIPHNALADAIALMEWHQQLVEA